MNESKKNALAQLREARAGTKKRTDQYEVAEVNNVFEEVNAEDYEKQQEAIRDDDFIVDDEGFGYKDNGGEIWDQAEDDEGPKGSKKKSRKVNKSDAIDKFMFPVSAMQASKKKQVVSKKGEAPVVGAQQSKDIMNNLFEDLDNQDAVDLQEHQV